jgi:hypothetical protein
LPVHGAFGERFAVAGAASIAAERRRLVHRGHHAIGHRAGGFTQRSRGFGNHGGAGHAVALHRIENVLARHFTLHVDGDRAVGGTGMSRHAPLQVDDAELAALDLWIGVQHADDLLGIGALLQLLEHEHVIFVRRIDAGLARGDAYAWDDDRLQLFEILR